MNEAPKSFDQHIAFFCCDALACNDWMAYHNLRLPIDDIGFRQGVTAVERMRTYQGDVFLPEWYLQRFANSLSLLGMQPIAPAESLRSLLDELLRRNAEWVAQQDIGITLWATPGSSHTPGDNRPREPGDASKPTWAMHLNGIDHDLVRRRRLNGQPVVVTSVVQPDDESWSRQAKVRCRLHYYLADREARSVHPEATGLLINSDGTVTESSIANLAIVNGGRIISPPQSSVLPGITQAWAEKTAARLGIKWEKRPLLADDLLSAEEVLLMGTDTGIWPACSVGSAQRKIVADGICQKLQSELP